MPLLVAALFITAQAEAQVYYQHSNAMGHWRAYEAEGVDHPQFIIQVWHPEQTTGRGVEFIFDFLPYSEPVVTTRLNGSLIARAGSDNDVAIDGQAVSDLMPYALSIDEALLDVFSFPDSPLAGVANPYSDIQSIAVIAVDNTPIEAWEWDEANSANGSGGGSGGSGGGECRICWDPSTNLETNFPVYGSHAARAPARMSRRFPAAPTDRTAPAEHLAWLDEQPTTRLVAPSRGGIQRAAPTSRFQCLAICEDTKTQAITAIQTWALGTCNNERRDAFVATVVAGATLGAVTVASGGAAALAVALGAGGGAVGGAGVGAGLVSAMDLNACVANRALAWGAAVRANHLLCTTGCDLLFPED